MANTLAALPNVLADITVPILEDVLAPLGQFCTEFTTENRRTVDVEKHTVVGATQENPSDYTTTADTTVLVPVTINEQSQQFGITAQDTLLGKSLERRTKRNAHALANTLWDKVTVLITNANFTNPTVDISGGAVNFDAADMKTLWASISGAMSKTCVLDSVAYANVMVIDSEDRSVANAARYSFDSVSEANRWSAAEAATFGFAAGPEAFLLASGIPDYGARVRQEIIDETIVEVPGVGISVAFRHQVDINARSEHATMDVLFGAAIGDETALTILKQVP